MRYDIENAVAEVVAAYLVTLVCKATQDASPIVTFFDPMSVDEANRIIVMVPQGETRSEDMGSGVVAVQLGIKSIWKQPTIEADFAAHFARVKEVRDKIFAPTDSMVTAMNAAAAAADPAITGIQIDWVDQKRGINTSVRELWLYTETSFQVSYFTTN